MEKTVEGLTKLKKSFADKENLINLQLDKLSKAEHEIIKIRN